MKKIVLIIISFIIAAYAQELTVYNKSNSPLLSNQVKAVVVDRDNNKWFATDNGVSVLYGIASWDSITINMGLSSNMVMDIMPDINRNDSLLLDIATNRGINRIKVNNYGIELLYNLTQENSGLVSDSVCCIALNVNGVAWFGTHKGCSTYDGDQWHQFTMNDYLISNDITDIASPENDYTFLASRDAGVSRMKQSVDGITGASEITTEWHKIASNNVYAVFVDSRGKRWFGTDKGVSVQYGEDFKANWTTFTTDSGLIDNYVTAIAEDKSGVMWFGTIAGLSSYDGIVWQSYTTDDGLSGNRINDLAIDKAGNVWAATDSGVSMFKTGYIKEYVVKKTAEPLIIDGVLDEKQWQNVDFTDIFVNQETGNNVKWGTKAKLLWDDQYLYIGFLAFDDDVWGEMTAHDSYLWKEEPVEFFCDPNGDTFNYFEIEINPLGTVLDLTMDKPLGDGGTGDFAWNVTGLLSAVSVNGTLNDPADIDTSWYCEMAIPFSAINASMTNPLSNPPTAGDIWRVELARYNRERDNEGNLISGGTETSCWNPTESSLFHVPEKFGKIIFSDETVTSVNETLPVKEMQFNLHQNYPNPFNPQTTIGFFIAENSNVKIDVYNIIGKKVKQLLNGNMRAGHHTVVFNAFGLSSGIYLYKMTVGNQITVKKMMILK